MHRVEKSDSSIVPVKRANKAAPAVAEPVEGRDGTKGNADLQSTVRTQSREAVSQAQERIRKAVNRNKKEKLTALLHHVTVDFLRAAFLALKRRAAAGVDAVTWEQYAEGLECKLEDLHRRLHAGGYRALPARRTYIPKADGKQRPLGIAAMEDKIVQAAVVMLLTPVYEAEFLGFSYGFRPGRSQHDALDALAMELAGELQQPRETLAQQEAELAALEAEFAAQRQKLIEQGDELRSRGEQIEHLKLLVEKLRRRRLLTRFAPKRFPRRGPSVSRCRRIYRARPSRILPNTSAARIAAAL